MGMFNPTHPPNIPQPPPAAHPAILGSIQSSLMGNSKKGAGAEASGMGFDDTIKSSQQGLKPPTTAKTLLG